MIPLIDDPGGGGVHGDPSGPMDYALLAKFSQNTDLRDELLDTGDSLIGEACSHDLLFGIGLSLVNPNAMDSSRWRGENVQGQTLMKVRDQLPAQNND